MKAGKIDLDYLARYTNAPVLVNGDPKSPEHGLFLKDDNGKPLVMDRVTSKLTPFDQPGVKPDLAASYRHAGITHKPVMHLMAERYLDPQYAPEAVAETCGISATKIKRIAAEIARVAFDEAIEIDQPWTDFRGEKHDKMVGRPSASMRCAGSRRIPTGSRPAARCTCCRSCWAASKLLAVSGSSRPIQSLQRRIPNRIAR